MRDGQSRANAIRAEIIREARAKQAEDPNTRIRDQLGKDL
jgi:hypothetical protein